MVRLLIRVLTLLALTRWETACGILLLAKSRCSSVVQTASRAASEGTSHKTDMVVEDMEEMHPRSLIVNLAVLQASSADRHSLPFGPAWLVGTDSGPNSFWTPLKVLDV